MEIHYINLERRADRDAAFRKINSHLSGLRRVNAVDGASLVQADLIRDGAIAEPLTAFSAGSLGNAMSHRLVWENCIRRGIGACVAEDDAVFNLHFEEKAAKAIASLPQDWDLIIWGWNFNSILDVEIIEGLKRSVMTFDGTKLGTKIEEFRKLRYDAAPLRLRGSFGTIAYSASPKGMRLLLENCFPLRNEVIHIPSLNRFVRTSALDFTLNRVYPILKSYAAVPPLAWTENEKSHSDVYPAPRKVI